MAHLQAKEQGSHVRVVERGELVCRLQEPNRVVEIHAHRRSPVRQPLERRGPHRERARVRRCDHLSFVGTDAGAFVRARIVATALAHAREQLGDLTLLVAVAASVEELEHVVDVLPLPLLVLELDLHRALRVVRADDGRKAGAR
jgi:hypothetical protein